MRARLAWAMASVSLFGVALASAGTPTPLSHTDNGRRIFLHGTTSAGRVVENSHGMEGVGCAMCHGPDGRGGDRKSTRLNSSHLVISHAVFCLQTQTPQREK